MPAFLVDYEEGQGIVFAKDAKEIEDDYGTVERAAKFDDFEEMGFVPFGYLHQLGWTFYCYECEMEVNSEAWDYEEDIQLNPIFRKDICFCSQGCLDAYESRIEQRDRFIKQAIAAARLGILG